MGEQIDNFNIGGDMQDISKMMTEIATANQETVKQENAATATATTPTKSYGNNNNFNNGDKPNIYMDEHINPKPVDMLKVKEAKAYAIIAIDENPAEELRVAMNKIADILKAKKVVYRYDNSVLPSLPRDIFMRQDLTMPNSYQLFLPYYKKDKFDLEGMCTITNKWASTLAAQHAKFYSKVTIKDKTDKTKVLEEYYAFSRTSGGARTNMANLMHLLLGKDCLTKLKFMIMYSSCGCETMEDVKLKGFKEVNRRVQDTIKKCKEFGIPLFNIGKPDGMKRLLELIQTLE